MVRVSPVVLILSTGNIDHELASLFSSFHPLQTFGEFGKWILSIDQRLDQTTLCSLNQLSEFFQAARS
jgi:aromatic ring-opening dioxygenase catalytic subunit (LigB family)